MKFETKEKASTVGILKYQLLVRIAILKYKIRGNNKWNLNINQYY